MVTLLRPAFDVPNILHVFMYGICLKGIIFSEVYCWLENYALENLEVHCEVISQSIPVDLTTLLLSQKIILVLIVYKPNYLEIH